MKSSEQRTRNIEQKTFIFENLEHRTQDFQKLEHSIPKRSKEQVLKYTSVKESINLEHFKRGRTFFKESASTPLRGNRATSENPSGMQTNTKEYRTSNF